MRPPSCTSRSRPTPRSSKNSPCMWADARDHRTEQPDAARDGIEPRRTSARRRLATSPARGSSTPTSGKVPPYASSGHDLNLDRQRAIVKALVDHVEILPGVLGARAVAIDRVRPGVAPLSESRAGGVLALRACARAPVACALSSTATRVDRGPIRRRGPELPAPRRSCSTRPAPLDPTLRGRHDHCTHTAGGPCQPSSSRGVPATSAGSATPEHLRRRSMTSSAERPHTRTRSGWNPCATS